MGEDQTTSIMQALRRWWRWLPQIPVIPGVSCGGARHGSAHPPAMTLTSPGLGGGAHPGEFVPSGLSASLQVETRAPTSAAGCPGHREGLSSFFFLNAQEIKPPNQMGNGCGNDDMPYCHGVPHLTFSSFHNHVYRAH